MVVLSREEVSCPLDDIIAYPSTPKEYEGWGGKKEL
jgi:hypothetical protein